MKKKKDSQARERMLLNILVERDKISSTGAAVYIERVPSQAQSDAAAILMRGRRACVPGPDAADRREALEAMRAESR